MNDIGIMYIEICGKMYIFSNLLYLKRGERSYWHFNIKSCQYSRIIFKKQQSKFKNSINITLHVSNWTRVEKSDIELNRNPPRKPLDKKKYHYVYE